MKKGFLTLLLLFMVSVNGANVRTAPTLDNTIKFQLQKGVTVEVVEEYYGLDWMLIQVINYGYDGALDIKGPKGWMHRSVLEEK